MGLLFGTQNPYASLIFNLRPFYGPEDVMNSMPDVGRQEEPSFMQIQEVNAERFAQLFHQYQQALADDFANPSGEQTKAPWSDMPPAEKRLMIAAARLALLEVELLPSERQSRRYFAKPGEANWGC
jgi:hypothetical protein